MSQNKLNTLTSYAAQLQSKLADKNLPEKHKNRPQEYKEFLERELKYVTGKIENLKMSLPSKK